MRLAEMTARGAASLCRFLPLFLPSAPAWPWSLACVC